MTTDTLCQCGAMRMLDPGVSCSRGGWIHAVSHCEPTCDECRERLRASRSSPPSAGAEGLVEAMHHATYAHGVADANGARVDLESRIARASEANAARAALLAHISRLEARAEEAERERDEARADVVAAAGELLVPIPPPGTDAARLLKANRLLKARAEAAESRERVLREALEACVNGGAFKHPQILQRARAALSAGGDGSER